MAEVNTQINHHHNNNDNHPIISSNVNINQNNEHLINIPLDPHDDNNDRDNNEQQQDEGEEEDDDEVRDNAIGIEAQNLLNIRNEISRPVSLFNFYRKGNFVMLLYLIPVTIALLTVLMVDWKARCARPLKAWVFAQILLQVIMGLMHTYFLFLPSPPSDDQPPPPRTACMKIMNGVSKILNLIWLTWFVVGMVWTFQAREDNCTSSAPYLFKMCLALMVVQIVIFSLVVLFCCCSCVVLVLRVVVNPNDLTPPPPRGATDSLLRSLPAKRFHPGLIKKEDASCAICLSEYEVDEVVRFLPCHHHYHRNCADKWLVTNKSCPFCKRNIDEPPPSGSSSFSSTTAQSPPPSSEEEDISASTSTTSTTTTTQHRPSAEELGGGSSSTGRDDYV
eukprot:TRINITY_DN7119_c0_g1_i1.p1 TRINITY_DN7119_c0_g1~~TRINITY_DN7119_c0_g1_i1.p1  ORF type:complete len:391 (-),score=114.61 TRINITY_DN7119_c0_g1_i1:14-1186(-)